MNKHAQFLLGCLTTVALFLTPTGCSKSDKPAGGEVATQTKRQPVASNEVRIDKAKVGAACERSFDCGMLEFGAECSFECEKGSDAKGYCQLRLLAKTAGQSKCYGDRKGVDRGAQPPSEKVVQWYYCDNDAGVYCNMGSNTCDPVKALGAACNGHSECGVDGACKDKVCVAAGAPGSDPIEGQCASSAYRSAGKCVARVADGQPCKQSDECQSKSCVSDGKSGTCKANDKVKACVL